MYRDFSTIKASFGLGKKFCFLAGAVQSTASSTILIVSSRLYFLARSHLQSAYGTSSLAFEKENTVERKSSGRLMLNTSSRNFSYGINVIRLNQMYLFAFLGFFFGRTAELTNISNSFAVKNPGYPQSRIPTTEPSFIIIAALSRLSMVDLVNSCIISDKENTEKWMCCCCSVAEHFCGVPRSHVVPFLRIHFGPVGKI